MRDLRNRIKAKPAGVAMVVVAMLAGSSYYYQVRQDAVREDCQARYNTAFAETSKIRGKLSGARQDAVDGLLMGVSRLILDPPKSAKAQAKAKEDYLQLFRDYNAAVKKNDAARDANPLPLLPEC